MISEPTEAWQVEYQEQFARGDEGALEVLMALPLVQEEFARQVEWNGVTGDEKHVHTRVTRALIKSHEKYDHRYRFEPWAKPFVRKGARDQKLWRRRPRKIYKMFAKESISTEFQQRVAEMRVDLHSALDSLTEEQRQSLRQFLLTDSNDEVAVSLGLSKKRIYAVKHKAIKALRAKFQD